jgi:Fur family ferric uptake transcriptional regulator
MKNSKKREKILEIFKNRDLLTANEVCEKLPEIDRATIYRNLSFFADQGILREVNVKKGISSYELNLENDFHQHFICKVCESISAVEINIKELKKILPKDLNFEQFELNLKGKCKNCI